MKQHCLICDAEVDEPNWRTTEIDGKRGWMCGIHFGGITYDVVPQRLKEDRKKHMKDTLQPTRSGEPSREFIETYPEQAQKQFSQHEMKKAKYVFKDQPGWNDHFSGN